MELKVGDKIKICKASRWKKRIKETVGVVRKICGECVEVKWETRGCVMCGIDIRCIYPTNIQRHKLYDIEPAVKIGEQLLLAFML